MGKSKDEPYAKYECKDCLRIKELYNLDRCKSCYKKALKRTSESKS